MIDGPAGAGKSTLARRLARHFGLPLLDTGAIYRSLALVARRRGVAWDDEPGLVALAAALPIRFSALADRGEGDADPPEPDAQPKVWLGDEDVTTAIRTPEISDGASRVSALPGVRAALLDLQRALGAQGCVAEGRDMGTVVFPDAPHKFFVTASLAERAARRRADLGAAHPGTEPALEAVSADLQSRDARDSSRATAPLARADDAVVIHTTGLDVDGALDLMLRRLAHADGEPEAGPKAGPTAPG